MGRKEWEREKRVREGEKGERGRAALGACVRVCAPTARPTLRHALEDVQEAHEEVLDLVPVQLVAAQHGAAECRRALVLKGGGQEKRCIVSLSWGVSCALIENITPAQNLREDKCHS